jgi:predicted metal-dependent hydrolase
MAEVRRAGGPAATGELEPWSCDETPPALFYTGLEQFNCGQYFEQHESLEEIWILEPRPIRYLYQGILKIGVGFYKLRLCNYRGTVNHINGGIAYLEPFGEQCLGVDIARLIRDATAVRDRALQLGPDRLAEFDLTTLPQVHFTQLPS